MALNIFLSNSWKIEIKTKIYSLTRFLFFPSDWRALFKNYCDLKSSIFLTTKKPLQEIKLKIVFVHGNYKILGHRNLKNYYFLSKNHFTTILTRVEAGSVPRLHNKCCCFPTLVFHIFSRCSKYDNTVRRSQPWLTKEILGWNLNYDNTNCTFSLVGERIKIQHVCKQSACADAR